MSKVHQQIVPEDEEDHRMLDRLMGVLNIPAQGEWSQISCEDAQTELDVWLEALTGGGAEDNGDEQNRSHKENEEDWLMINIKEKDTFEEWVVTELESIYFPQQITSEKCTGALLRAWTVGKI